MALALPLFGCHDSESASPGEIRNLLMISVDTWRRDRLARYGHQGDLTPFTDELLSRSVVFDRHTSCSDWTFTAIVCTLNGRYNMEFGFIPRIWPDYREVTPARPTLAGWLGEAGFHSILLSSNGWVNGEWHQDDNYDFASTRAGRAMEIYELGRDQLLEAIEAGADPWFLHLHLMEPHSPYVPPDSYLQGLEDLAPIDYDLTTVDGHDEARAAMSELEPEERELLLQHMKLRYEAELRYLDDQLQAIWSDLEQHQLLDDTLAVFWSDHGEQLWEREQVGHAYELKSEELDALAFYWHQSVQPRSWAEPTVHIDLVPTILDFFGLPMPQEVTGFPLGIAPADRAVKGLTVARLGPVQSLTRGDLRMHYYWTGGALELFDLQQDPGELNDIYDPTDAEAAELWAIMEADALALEPLVPEYERELPARR